MGAIRNMNWTDFTPAVRNLGLGVSSPPISGSPRMSSKSISGIWEKAIESGPILFEPYLAVF
jgi:hypothetical protein